MECYDFIISILHKHKKRLIYAFCLIALLIVVFFSLCYIAKSEAVKIFNKHMAKQKTLNGTIAVKELSADITGNVYFYGLSWKSGDENILFIPEGRIKVDVFDVVARRISITSIKELELNNAKFNLEFNDKMELDVLSRKAAKEKRNTPGEANKGIKNINLTSKLPNTLLIINDAKISAFYKHRRFVFDKVKCKVNVTQHKLIDMSFRSGALRGTIVGDSCDFSGRVDLGKTEPQLKLNLGIYGVVPESLGLGKIKDPISITGEVKGALHSPEADGAIMAKTLTFPSMKLSKVYGNYNYRNGVVTFRDVNTVLYGGEVEAYGIYNIDKRSYQIHAKGAKLRLEQALKRSGLKGPADAKVDFLCDGNNADNLIMGEVNAGPGRYRIIHFKKIRCKVVNQHKSLYLRDIELETFAGKFVTDHVKVENHHVDLGPIFMQIPGKQDVLVKEQVSR